MLEPRERKNLMSQILTSQAAAVEAPFGKVGPTWQESLKLAVRSGRELLKAVDLPLELSNADAEADFPVFAPWEYIRRMHPSRADDPLLLQVLGTHHEVGSTDGQLDPVGDSQVQWTPGLLKKYARRALLITSGACAVHCRYCFRRHFPYNESPTGPSGWQPALDAIASDASIDEVILSGGDPLSVRDSSLQWLIHAIDGIPHVRRIRVHTRFPVMIPQRVCEPLLAWVSGSRCAMVFVLHFNHAFEMDEDVVAAISKLRSAGATLLNQSVLLKGINDSVDAQRELCQRLINVQVIPYYLHQLDRVRGATHFEVSDKLARKIIGGLRKELPGYGVPQLVREIAGEPSKSPV